MNPENETNDVSNDFVIGRHPAVAALRSQQTINKVFLQSGLKAEAIDEIRQLAKKRHLVISEVPKQKLDQLTDHQNHQGVALGVAAFEMLVSMTFAKAEAAGEGPSS